MLEGTLNKSQTIETEQKQHDKHGSMYDVFFVKKQKCSALILLFFKVFVGPRSILWGNWYPLFRSSDDSDHEFQSQGVLILVLEVETTIM